MRSRTDITYGWTREHSSPPEDNEAEVEVDVGDADLKRLEEKLPDDDELSGGGEEEESELNELLDGRRVEVV